MERCRWMWEVHGMADKGGGVISSVAGTSTHQLGMRQAQLLLSACLSVYLYIWLFYLTSCALLISSLHKCQNLPSLFISAKTERICTILLQTLDSFNIIYNWCFSLHLYTILRWISLSMLYFCKDMLSSSQQIGNLNHHF